MPNNTGTKKKKIKAGDEIRTRDIHLGRVTLYQLSYSRAVTKHYAITGRTVKLSTVVKG